MPLLVDTSNVLHVTGVLPPILAGVDVLGLADLLEVGRYRTETVWLVCDGAAGPHRPTLRGRIVTHYVGHTGEADDQIGRMIAASTSPRRLLVISSDNQVRKMAQRRRCRWLSSEDFLAQLAHDGLHAVHRGGGPPGTSPRRGAAARAAASPAKAVSPRAAVPLKSAQVNSWVRHFGLDPSWLAIESSRPGSDGEVADGIAEGASSMAAQGAGEATASQADRVPATQPTAQAKHAPNAYASAPLRKGRALEGVRTLAEVDPAELERFDMSEWLPPAAGQISRSDLAGDDGARGEASPGAARDPAHIRGEARGTRRDTAEREADKGRRGRSTKRRRRKS